MQLPSNVACYVVFKCVTAEYSGTELHGNATKLKTFSYYHFQDLRGYGVLCFQLFSFNGSAGVTPGISACLCNGDRGSYDFLFGDPIL